MALRSSRPNSGSTHRSLAAGGAFDWPTLEHKFTTLFSLLRAPANGLSSQEERERTRRNLELGLSAVIDVAINESNRLLREGDYENALQGAIKTLRFTQELHGSGHLALVPVYILLAKCNQKLRRFKQAEEFLSLCNWSMLKNSDVSSDYRVEVFRTTGLLFHSQGRFEEALRQLALCVYHQSLKHGPESVHVSFGYFQLASVFASQGRPEAALSFFRRIVEIWLHALMHTLGIGALLPPLVADAVSERAEKEARVAEGIPASPTPAPADDENGEESSSNAEKKAAESSHKSSRKPEELTFDDAQKGEILDMLQVLLSQYTQRFGDRDVSTARASLVVALGSVWRQDMATAHTSLHTALSIYDEIVGPEHHDSTFVRNIASSLGMDL